MDIGGMDVEEFGQHWRRARHRWDRLNQAKLQRDAAGSALTAAELAEWRLARAEFEAAERLWDQAYQAGVVIVVGEDDAAD